MTLKNNNQQHYRLAVYGMKSSGKTCILSALSLPRIAHPKGLSCSWIQNDPRNPLPQGAPETWQTDNPFHLGWKWLGEQRDRLKRGEVPEANPSREPMKFLFDFGCPDYGTRHVELVDYSGELITASASELAGKLREHMQDCDGLLVLAEIPHANRDHKPLVDDLQKLTSAFSELLNERETAPRQEWPIALLLNKWDRRSQELEITVSDSDALIRGFIEQSPAPPHASLLNTIRNAVGEKNVKCFPVSAFGSHKILPNGTEVPQVSDGQLQSFGLEDGFNWCAHQADSLRVQELRVAEENASWWAFPQMILGLSDSAFRCEQSPWKRWIRGISVPAGIYETWEHIRSLPKGTDLHKRATTVLARFGLKFATQLTAFFLVSLFSLLLIESTIDGIRYRGIISSQNNPSATTADLSQGEQWLDTYFRSPSYRHVLSHRFILDRATAYSLLVDLRTQRDNSLWKTVTDAENRQTKVSLARNYLAEFESGLHSPEAKTLVADTDREEHDLKNREFLDQLSIKLDAVEIKADAPVNILHDLSDKISSLPYPESRSQSNTDRQAELRKNIAEKQRKIIEAQGEMEWKKFEQSYVTAMQNNDILLAAGYLAKRNPIDSNGEGLINDFAERAPKIVSEKVRGHLKNRSWQQARELTRVASDPNVVKLLETGQRSKLADLATEINEAEDKDLYSQIVRYKPQCGDQVSAYISRAPLKTMLKEVESYREYLNAKKDPLDMTLILSTLQWHDRYYGNFYSYENDVTVIVKGLPLITATKIKSNRNERSSQIGSGTFRAQLNETVTIDVSVVAKYGVTWTSTTPGGSGRWTGTPNELQSGVTIDLNGQGFTNKATFRLNGLPPEPQLPEWRNQ